MPRLRIQDQGSLSISGLRQDPAGCSATWAPQTVSSPNGKAVGTAEGVLDALLRAVLKVGVVPLTL